MSEMIERAAKALIERQTPGSPTWRGHAADERELAQIVIAAMREPTEAMLDVGADVLEDMPRGSSRRELADAVWDSMIQSLLPDEALK